MSLFAALAKIRADVRKNRLFGIPIRPEPGQRPGVDGLDDAPPWLKAWLKKWLPIIADFTIAAYAAGLASWVFLYFLFATRNAMPAARATGFF